MQDAYEGATLLHAKEENKNQSNSNSELAKCEFLLVPSLQPIKEELLCQE